MDPDLEPAPEPDLGPVSVMAPDPALIFKSRIHTGAGSFRSDPHITQVGYMDHSSRIHGSFK